MTDEEVDRVIENLEQQHRLSKPERGSVTPGTESQAAIDALPSDYWPEYRAQQLGMVATGKGKRKRTGWSKFWMKVRRVIEK